MIVFLIKLLIVTHYIYLYDEYILSMLEIYFNNLIY